MKKVIKQNSTFFASQAFTLVLALAVTFSMGFVGKGFSKGLPKDRAASEALYTIEKMQQEEKMEVLDEVMSSGVNEVVDTPMTIKIFNTNEELLYKASGTPLELMNNKKLSGMLENSNLLMEMANEFYYLKK